MPVAVHDAMHPGPIDTLNRRRMLALLIWAPAAIALVACSSDPSEPDPSTPGATDDVPTATPEPDPDLLLLSTAAGTAATLLASYRATVSVHAGLAAELDPLARDHQAHVTELVRAGATDPAAVQTPSDPAATTGGASGTDSSSPTGSAGGGTGQGPTPSSPGSADPLLDVPTDPQAARAALVAAESGAGEVARSAAEAARAGELARLLASVAACRVSHAELLSPS